MLMNDFTLSDTISDQSSVQLRLKLLGMSDNESQPIFMDPEIGPATYKVLGLEGIWEMDR